jgi:YihY family inner membrane protein
MAIDPNVTAPSGRSIAAEPMAREARERMPAAGDEAVTPSLEAALAKPVREAGTWEQVKALGGYMAKTEVHTYAFSVAAQVILSLFPFIVMLLTITEHGFHSEKMTSVVGEMLKNLLPNNQKFVVDSMQRLAHAHPGTRAFSIVMLLITSTGVFLPLEVALNSVWGVAKNRSYLANQIVSIGLAFGVGVLAMASVAMSAAQQKVTGFLFFGHTDNVVFNFVAGAFLQIVSLLAGIGLFFLIYWGLPNRKVPPRAVMPTAIVIGVLWTIAKYIYIWALPHLDFASTYGPFQVSVGLMMGAFISGLLLLAGAYVSATRQALREAAEEQ